MPNPMTSAPLRPLADTAPSAVVAGFIAMIVLALVGLATIYIRQRNGLHAKHRDKGIYIYHGIFKH